MIRRLLAAALAPAILALPSPSAMAAGPVATARAAEPVVLTGADLPTWSRLPAVGAADPTPPPAVSVRDAHNGTLTVPPDAREGAPVDEIAAFRWEDGAWVEIPVQVDEVFPYFLANVNSDFSMYSGTDKELTYEWDVESWKLTAGECRTAYPEGEGAMQDPVATLDDDDEIAFMADEAGAMAPAEAPGPAGTTDHDRQQVTLVDPLDPSVTSYAYLFRRPGGSTFDASNGYVRYDRHDDADEWIDRNTFSDADPEKLGSSNTGYGPNLSGTVCTDDPDTPEVETLRQTTDRFPRDGVTVTTDAYRWEATGRWMIRSMQVAKPGQPGVYGPDLIDRWKGRAFQQSPDSTVSLVGFEDEQVNWEANATLLGERTGPVRAIRETWGADSGTNVTKTETFYRDAVTYRYRVRVHPIPPDGLYTSWDYNAGVATKYFNVLNPEGADIDGINDDQGNVDEVGGFPAFFDAPDPTFSPPTAIYQWEQVSGAGDTGSLVYTIEPTGPTTFANPAVVPYYRDDKCLDDGTGDDPVARPWPGEASTDQRVQDGYAAMAGTPYSEVTCDEKQGAWGSHGVHFFVTHDTDNAFTGENTTEIDARQWQFAVPTQAPAAVGEPYGNVVRTPLQAVAAPLDNPEGEPEPEPAATRIELSAPPRKATKGPNTQITARLLEAEGGAPVDGQTVRFLVNGAVVATAVTDDSGGASHSRKLKDGDVLRVEFDGNADHAASATEAVYTTEAGASG